MKIETKHLRAALERLARIVSAKNFHLIIPCVRMEAKAGTLTLFVTNFDERMTEDVPCDGDLALCCPDLRQLAFSIGGENCAIELHDEVLFVLFDGKTTQLKTQKPEEYPTMPVDKFREIGVNCADLAVGIKSVAWAAKPPNSSRYVLESVHVVGSPKALRCQASSGSTLPVWEMPSISADFEVVIPAPFAAHLSDALRRDGAVLAAGEKLIRVAHDAGSYECNQLDARYPNTSPILDEQKTPLGTCVTADLLDAFTRCDYFADPPRTPLTEVKFSKKGIAISFTHRATLSLNISGSFADHTARLNASSFKQCVAAIDADEVKIYAGDQKIMLEAGNLRVITMEIRSA